MSTTEHSEDESFVKRFRHWNNPRRHAPIVWWDGDTWNMSVRDQHNQHHTKCSYSWTEIMGFAIAWQHVNALHGLLPIAADDHGLAA
jgi:hypothetical protein